MDASIPDTSSLQIGVSAALHFTLIIGDLASAKELNVPNFLASQFRTTVYNIM
jgi:hypothetical protein